jgi:hypothetical protein
MTLWLGNLVGAILPDGAVLGYLRTAWRHCEDHKVTISVTNGGTTDESDDLKMWDLHAKRCAAGRLSYEDRNSPGKGGRRVN